MEALVWDHHSLINQAIQKTSFKAIRSSEEKVDQTPFSMNKMTKMTIKNPITISK
jgi:hypothetical protein